MPFVYLVTNCRENILTLSFMASSHFPEAFRLKKQKTREIKNIVRAWVKLNVSQRPTEQGFIQLVTLNNSLQKKTGWLHVSVCVCVCVCVEIYIYIYIYISTSTSFTDVGKWLKKEGKLCSMLRDECTKLYKPHRVWGLKRDKEIVIRASQDW